MKTKKLKKVLSVILLVVVMTVIMSVYVFADFDSTVTTINENIRGVATVFIAFCALATAILYMSSSVNPKLKGTAKDALIGLIIGVVIFALSDSIGEMICGFFQ